MNDKHQGQETKKLAFSIPIGAGFGVALELVLSQVLDHPGFFALGIGIGLSLGVTIGLALDARQRSR